ncbi:uncharacterized protein M421DRAFT_418809 [Didymella exigua CBS 183.55]|uniref:Uncharacterized protein n=1 Tax=Didymella exigua CBS 183.55 TaxID=1150837 RepID=A0A6A5RSD0_9PLEO|nr:uncharacterized protein M421DRAFT_418809 [Didymella exigua CBS 183.55]KAF1930499.1 hypothetical protein M421DRAFT_418809 [Didymella exigua CBS 183.55]
MSTQNYRQTPRQPSVPWKRSSGGVTSEVAGVLPGKLSSEAAFRPWKSHMHGLIMKNSQELDAFMENAKRDALRMCEGLSKSDRAEAADRYRIWHEYVVAAVTAILVFLQKSITAVIDHKKVSVAGSTTSDADVRLAIKEWELDAISAVKNAHHKADAIFGRRL